MNLVFTSLVLLFCTLGVQAMKPQFDPMEVQYIQAEVLKWIYTYFNSDGHFYSEKVTPYLQNNPVLSNVSSQCLDDIAQVDIDHENGETYALESKCTLIVL